MTALLESRFRRWFPKNVHPSTRRPCRRADRFFRPWLEPLEHRLAPAIVTWVNPQAGDWAKASNWSDGSTPRLPGPGDEVVIPALPGVIMYNRTDSIKSLTSVTQLGLTGGTLTVSTTAQLSASLTLWGGTLKDATVTMANGAEILGSTSGGTLDGIVLNGDLDLTSITRDVNESFRNGVTVTVVNGLTLNGQARVGNAQYGDYWGGLLFSGSQTLNGNGSIVLGAGHDTFVKSVEKK